MNHLESKLRQASKEDMNHLESKLRQASKEDMNHLESKLRQASKEDMNHLELKVTGIIHQELRSIGKEIHANNWRTIVWMTTVLGGAFSGVIYIARYLPAH